MNASVLELQTAFERGDLERARSLADAQLARDPRQANVLHFVGLIECRRGNPGEGAEWLLRALELEQENAAFRVMAVRALVDAGRAAEALDQALIGQSAGSARLALWHARAEAASAAEKWDEAATAWSELTKALPDRWHWWASLADAFAHLERWSDAQSALAHALALNSSEASLRRNLAATLVRCNRFDEALEIMRQLVDLEPANAELRISLARINADLGKHAEAMEQLDEAARLTISQPAAGGTRFVDIILGNNEEQRLDTSEAIAQLKELALILERTNQIEALEQLLADAEEKGVSAEQIGYAAAANALRHGEADRARAILSEESSAEDPVRWHQLMAKIEDASGRPAEAFHCAELMNRAVHDFDDWLRRGEDYRARLRRLAASLGQEWVKDRADLPPEGVPAPAFLVGFPRSGTTLLDTFLMGHPHVHVIEEEHMLGAAEKVLGDLFDLPRRSRAELTRAREAYLNEMNRHVPDDFAGLIVDKLPLNMLGLPVIRSLFPEAKVVFAQRHPCDPVLSGFMQSFVMNDAMASFLTIEGAADLYDAALTMWTRSREIIPLEIHTIAYEQLVVDPEPGLRKLIEFLGLEWSDELLDHRATAARRGAVITPSYNQIVKPLYRSASGRWIRYKKQLEPVLPILLPWAQRLGYDSH